MRRNHGTPLFAKTLAVAGCLLQSAPSLATCDNPTPGSGQTTTCSNSAPNPSTIPIAAAGGSTGVTIDVLQGAAIDVNNGNAILVHDRSRVTNYGSLSVTGDTFDGISAQGVGAQGNALINRGFITTNGDASEGMFSSTRGTSMLNDVTGTIRTLGSNSAGMVDFQSPGGNTLVNNGRIDTAGPGSHAMAIAAPTGSIVNNGTLTTGGLGSAGMFSAGDISGQAPNGSGTATLVNNGAIQTDGRGGIGIVVLNTALTPVTNNGTIVSRGPESGGAFLNGPTTFVNGAGASISVPQGDGVIANGGGTVRNAGTISASGIGLFLGGAAVVDNSGTITSSAFIAIQSAGSADIHITNSGKLAGANSAVLTDAGNDSFTMSAGSTTGIVNLAGGSNTITLTGGTIGSGLRTGTGPANTLLWQDGGTIIGPVSLNGDDNRATLRRLTGANLAELTVLQSGSGTGTLTFDATTAGNASRFTNWTTVNLANGSQLTLDKPGLVLGNAGIGAGTLNIDATSMLFAGGLGDPPISPAQAGQRVTVNNAGIIDLTNGGTGTSDVLAITGNYVGKNGHLLLQAVLGADDSLSDKLVIAHGTASGSTALGVTNVGGTGGATVADGILVVQSISGTTTTASAFTLPARLTAGAFVYYLFKGGVSAGTADNWYLRSSLAPAPDPASTPVPSPTAATGTPPLPAPPPPGASPTPLYRMEVPVYAGIAPAVRELNVAQLGMFHDRQGDQSFLSESGALRAAWARAWGGHATFASGGAVSPEFSGGIGGLQIGHDIYAQARDSGHRDHFGAFAGFARASGDVDGFALGFQGFAAGHLAVNAYNLGGYWTHVGPTGWYTDAVVMGSSLVIDPTSGNGIGPTTHGNAIYTSLEGGVPIPLTPTIDVEPQAQLIWQRTRINDLDDGISTVSFHSDGSLIGRIGARMQGRFERAGALWRPYFRANLWRYFGGTDSQTYAASTVVSASASATAAEFALGLATTFSARGSAFFNVSYTANVGGATRSIVTGNAGVRLRW